MNSFGYGGTNAHLVIDDAFHYLQSRGLSGRHNVQLMPTMNGTLTPLGQPSSKETDPEEMLFLLAAADENGVGRQASVLASHLENDGTCAHSEEYLQDLAFTLSKSRAQLPWKSCALASTLLELRKSLVDIAQKPVRSTESPSVQFVFTGQGAQWASMGVELLRFAVFKSTIEHADTYFRSLGSKWSALGK